jgi:hypothetical protein
MRGTRKQARVAAQLRSRRRVNEHDRLLAAYYRAEDVVARDSAQLIPFRCGQRLRVARFRSSAA